MTTEFKPANVDDLDQDPEAFWSVYRTMGAETAIVRAGQTTAEFLGRHMAGDWGEASAEIVQQNEASLKTDNPRIVSCFRTALGEEIFYVTELEGHRTEILLARQYFEEH